MMKSLKKYLALVLALLMCLSLAACGNDDAGDGDAGDVSGSAPDSFEGMVKDDEPVADYGMYCGLWVCDDGREMEVEKDDQTQETRFVLYSSDGEEIDASGYIQLSTEYSADYFYNEHDGIAYHSWFDEDGTLNVYSFGNDNWMTKTVTVFSGVILRCADMCDANLDMSITDRYQESPPKGDVSDPAVFAERFKVRTSDGREAAALVTPEMRTLCSELEKAVDGKLCVLKLKDGEAAAALHTKYQFANVPPNTDLRNIDGIRKAYVESIETIKTLLDILKNNL